MASGNTTVTGLTVSGATTSFNNKTYTWPNNPTLTAGKFLQTDASGNLTWASLSGGGDMSTSTYDTNLNGIVDNSEKIGGSTWPANASGVLTNDGTGALTWAPGSGTYTAGTGLTLAANAFSVNTSQNISTLSNLTSNGLIKTSGGTGVLSIATSGTDYLAPFGSQSAKFFYAAPNGAAGVPSFRAIVASDIPTLNQNTTGSAGSVANALTVDNSSIQLSSGTTYNGSAAVTMSVKAAGITNAMLAGSIAASKLIGTDITTVGTITAGTWNGTKISEAYGGTNQTSYAAGDILYASSPTTLTKLAIGSPTQVLTVNAGGTAPVWAAASGSSGWSLTGNSLAGTEFIGSTNGQDLVFKANSTEGARLNTSGYFGIGTTTPSTQLHVMWNLGGNINPIATIETSGVGSSAALRFKNSSGQNYNMGILSTGDFSLSSLSNNVSVSDILRVSAAGNVGISASSPISKLDVNGDLHLSQITAPSPTTDKLYNVGGNLFWNGTNISSGGSGFSTANTIPKGNGTGLIASSLYDDGTAVNATMNNASGYGFSISNNGGVPGLSGRVALSLGVNASATEDIYGIALNSTGGSSANNDAIYAIATGSTSRTRGIAAGAYSGTATNIGVDVYAQGSGASSGSFGVYTNVNGGGSNYGIYNGVSGGSLTNYGVYNNISGTNAYGIYSVGETYNYFSGKMGIGTTTPISTLDVMGDVHLAQIAAPGSTTDKLYNVGGSLFWNGTNISSVVPLQIPANGDVFEYSANNTVRLNINNASGQYEFGKLNAAGTPVFSTNWNTGNTYIAGNLGVGTSSPATTLDVNGNAYIRGSFIGLGGATSTIGSSALVLLDDNGASSYGGMYINSNATGKPFYGYALGGSNVAWTYVDGTDSKKWKLNNGTTDVVTVDQSGNVGIGTTAPTYMMHVNGSTSVNTFNVATTTSGALSSSATFSGGVLFQNQIILNAAQNVTGSVVSTFDNIFDLGSSSYRWHYVYAGNGTIQTSDVRLKDNVKSLNYGLKEVMSLRPVSYTWKKDSTNKVNLGLIAQEVLKVVPEAVHVPTDGGYLGMNYSNLIPVLIKSIQEQQKLIDEQKKQIEGLKQQQTQKETKVELELIQLKAEIANIKKALGMEASAGKDRK